MTLRSFGTPLDTDARYHIRITGTSGPSPIPAGERTVHSETGRVTPARRISAVSAIRCRTTDITGLSDHYVRNQTHLIDAWRTARKPRFGLGQWWFVEIQASRQCRTGEPSRCAGPSRFGRAGRRPTGGDTGLPAVHLSAQLVGRPRAGQRSGKGPEGASASRHRLGW